MTTPTLVDMDGGRRHHRIRHPHTGLPHLAATWEPWVPEPGTLADWARRRAAAEADDRARQAGWNRMFGGTDLPMVRWAPEDHDD